MIPERTYVVTEPCPHCGNEIEMRWNTDADGFKAFCPVCGKRLMLCDECIHAEDYRGCDYNSASDSCYRNEEAVKVDYARGDIYYVHRTRFVGSEQSSGRPAIIVSLDANNKHSNVAEVVYLTTRPKKDLPTHVQISATGRPSIALCEQVHSVDCRRLGRYVGKCDTQEMEAVDEALLISLGLKGKR